MRLRYVAIALLVAASPALPHDFWIQPSRFQVPVDSPLPMTFLIGHGSFRDRWRNNDRIILLGDFFGDRRADSRRDLQDGVDADFVTRLTPAGLHVVGLQSNTATSELPAIRFNDYAKTEGLTLILNDRERKGQTRLPGRERYSRRAKTLIQVGAQTAANQGSATRPIGLKLEIVPDRNPYALDASRILPVHVLYNGRRLANATVKLTNLANDEKPVAISITNRAGQARFRIPAGGNWLLNVVWGEPVTGDKTADFDTTFSSLTFGYPAVQRKR